MDNRAYSQFDDSPTPSPQYGAATAAAAAPFASDTSEGKALKKWKNSRRLCYALLITSLVTLFLEIVGAGITGVHLDWLLSRFVVGVWLAALGVIGAALGLRAFKNPYESSKCWTVSHFVMCILATVAYAILFLMSATDVYSAREAIETYHDYVDIPEDDEPLNTTMSANATTTTEADPTPLLNAIKGDLTISVFLLGTTLAFFILSIVANIIICRHWCRGNDKSMTIVYTSQDGSTPQSYVVPAKTKVVVLPAPTTGPTDQTGKNFA